MRKKLLTAVAVVLGAALGVASAVWAAGETTGTNTVCATATLPAHTVGVDNTGVYTISGTSTSACHTQTYTIPTSTTTVAASGTTTTPPNASIGACGANPPGGTWTVGAQQYTQTGLDTFTKAQASGAAWSNGNDTTPVYTGDHGMQWVTYPDGWGANGVTPAYQPSTVLSVHDNVLDFYLHNELGSSPSPLPSGNQYQTYGAWSMCEKVAPDSGSSLRDFKQAILLWPQNDANGGAAESDFPEGNFTDPSGNPSTLMSAFAHYSAYPTQDSFQTGALDLSQWHVYTQTWGPGFRCYYVDGTQIGCSTSSVWSQPERWQLQIQPLSGSTTGGHGHVYINWVWVGSPASQPVTTTSTTPTTSTTSTTGTTTTTTPPPPPPAGKITHVAEIWLENQDYANIYGPQPEETSLADTFGLATSYYAIGHFSADNYVAATSGAAWNSCLGGDGSPSSCPQSQDNLFHQLGSGQAVNLIDPGNTDVNHNPAEYYTDLGCTGPGSCPYEQTLPSSFTSSTFNPAFTFITPNKTDDGHDSSAATADSWLAGEMAKLEATPQYTGGTMAIFVVWDESNVNDTQGATSPPNNHVYLSVVSPYTSGVKDATQMTHYSLLRKVESLLGVPLLGGAASAPDMGSAFGF